MSRTVLLVDDDPVFCDALGRALTRRGCEVFQALDTAQGLVMAQTHRPQCAVIDLRIGEESGLQLVQQLKNELPDIRMVMLTGFASIATAVEAIKLGAVHYLTKPAEPDEILQAFDKQSGDADMELPDKPMSVRRLEWEHIQSVLKQHDGNISAAARALGMHRRSLQRKLQKHPSRS